MSSPPQTPPSQPLRRRLGVAFALFGTALFASYFIVLPQLLFYSEDSVFESIVGAQVRHMQSLPLPLRSDALPVGMRVADAPTGLGLRAAQQQALSSLAPDDSGIRIQEWLDIPLDGEITDCFAAVFDHQTGARHFALYDVGALESFDENQAAAPFLIAIGIGAVLCIGGILASMLLTRKVATALGTLHKVANTPPSEDSAALIAQLGDDETGAIARAFDNARNALARALDRERQFTRNASHELRTPLTVARGASELLLIELPQNATRARDLVARIDAATQQIEDLVVAFLWLARSERGEPEHVEVDVVATTRRVAQTLAQSLNCSVEACGLDLPNDAVDLRINAPPRVIDTLIRNLLDNALRHRATDSIVTLRYVSQGVEIANAVEGEPAAASRSAESYGFGLYIVRELCERFGWQLVTKSSAQQHSATLHLTPPD